MRFKSTHWSKAQACMYRDSSVFSNTVGPQSIMLSNPGYFLDFSGYDPGDS